MSKVRIDNIAHGTQIDQIIVPDKLRERYPFHGQYSERLQFVTNLYGGSGITPSTLTLLTGTPGSGKSTLAIQMANALHQRRDCMVLFNGGEESLFQTRLVCERLFKVKTPTFFVGQDSLIDPDNLEMDLSVRHAAKTGARKTILGHAKLLKQLYPNKHLVIIQDSLQTADDGKLRDGATNNSTVLRSLKLFNEHCKTTFDSAILIGQVTKNGDAAGANKLIHDIDVWLHMHIDTKDKSETQGMRIIATKKNRYGFSGQAHVISMWDDGLKEEGMLDES
jgi:DNA repair protein RadA/Sms